MKILSKADANDYKKRQRIYQKKLKNIASFATWFFHIDDLKQYKPKRNMKQRTDDHDDYFIGEVIGEN